MERQSSRKSGAPAYDALAQDHTTKEGENRGRISGRSRDILSNSILLTVPMLLFAALLVGLVFHNRVQHTSKNAANPDSQLPIESDEPGVFYVDISSTRLIFIASWSSSLAPMLVASIIALWSYQVAQRVAEGSLSGDAKLLPTSYQLALTLGMVDGGVYSSLYRWVKQMFGSKGRRQAQGNMLTSMGSVAALGVVLSFLVFAADTWLHLVIWPVEFVRTTSLSSSPGYSFGLSDGCSIGNNSEFWQLSFTNFTQYCSLNIGGTNTFLNNASLALKTLNNVSDIAEVKQHESGMSYTILGVPDSPSTATMDYVSSTYGLHTQCQPIAQSCNFAQKDGARTPFHCSEAFSGDVTQLPWQMTYFTDSSMTDNNTLYGVQNPYFFGLAALVNLDGERGNLSSDPEITDSMHGGTAFALFCNTTVYDIVYASVNGTITEFEPQVSNTSASNIVQGSMEHVDLADPYLQLAASIAVEVTATAQEMADQLALAYSKAALSLFSASVRPRPAIEARTRRSMIVSRLPVAPLFSLVVANLLFVLVGLVLLVIILSMRDKDDASDVQARLSVIGLVADRFEQPHASKGAESLEELFEEHEGTTSARIGIERSGDGGWQYRTWRT